MKETASNCKLGFGLFVSSRCEVVETRWLLFVYTFTFTFTLTLDIHSTRLYSQHRHRPPSSLSSLSLSSIRLPLEPQKLGRRDHTLI